MADLISQPNFANQIAEAAAIPGSNANQWANVGQTQAQTGLIGQQATAAGLQNQITQMTMPLIQSAIQGAGQNQNYGFNTPMNPINPFSPTSPGVGDTGTGPGTAAGSQVGESSGQGTAGTAAQSAPVQGAPGVTGPGTGAAGAGTASAAAPDPNHFVPNQSALTDTWAEQTLRPVPTARPDEINRQILALELAGRHDAAQAIGARYDQAVAGENQRRMALANQTVSAAQDIYTSDNPRGTMERVAPGEEKMLPKDATDDQIKALAAHTIASSFMYTGRGTDINNEGDIIDAQSKRPIAGMDRVGLSNEDKKALLDDANAPVSVMYNGSQQTLAKWQLLGYNSAEDMMTRQAIAAKKAGMTSGQYLSTQNGQGQQASSQNIQAQPPQTNGSGAPTPLNQAVIDQMGGKRGAAASASTTSNAPANQGVQGTPGNPGPNAPVVNNAGVIKSTNGPMGQVNLASAPNAPALHPSGFGGQTPEQANAEEQQKTAWPEKIQEMQTTQQVSQAGLARDRYLLSLLPKTATGPMTAWAAKAQLAMQNAGMGDVTLGQIMKDPNARAIMDKFLTQESVDSLNREVSQTGGGSVRFSAMLAELASGKMSPSVQMGRQAIQEMLKWDIANHTYNQEEVNAFNKAVGQQHKDPLQFQDWYENQYHRNDVIPRYMQALDSQGNMAPQGAKNHPYAPSSVSEAAQVPSGSYFVAPGGKIPIKRAGQTATTPVPAQITPPSATSSASPPPRQTPPPQQFVRAGGAGKGWRAVTTPTAPIPAASDSMAGLIKQYGD